MGAHDVNYTLPRNIEKHLATLSKLYAFNGKYLLQEIVVNSRVRIHEAWSYDNWNGGSTGHAIYLDIPEVLYLKIFENKVDVQGEIARDLNNIKNESNEYVEEVFL